MLREHDEQLRVRAPRRRPDDRRAATPPASGPGERDERIAPRRRARRARIFTYAPMNGMNIGSRHLEPLPPRLDDVAELVHEDQQHEAERERPAVEPERVRRDGDEEAEELDEDEAPLERGGADGEREPADALERFRMLGRRRGLDRLVVAHLVHHSVHSRSASQPLLAALVELFLPERNRLLERVDRLAAGVERGRRGAARRRRSRRSARRSLRGRCDGGSRPSSEAVLRRQLLGEAAQHRLGHLLERLVLEVQHRRGRATAAHGADERRDRSGLVALGLAITAATSSGSAVIRKAPPETGGISATSSPSCSSCVALDVRAVDGVEQARRLVAEVEPRPDVLDAS